MVMAVTDRLGFLMTDPVIRRVPVPLDNDSLNLDPLRAAVCVCVCVCENISKMIFFSF